MAVANQLFVIAFAFFLISIRAFAGSDGILVSILEVENDSLIVIEQLTGDAMILGLVLPTHRIANLLDGCGNTQDDSVGFCIGRAGECYGVRGILFAGTDSKTLSVRVHQELHMGGVVKVYGGVYVELEFVAVHRHECFGFATDKFDYLEIL